MPREEHGDLAGKGDIFRAALAGHVRETNIEMFRDFFLDDFNADRVSAFFVKHFAQQPFHHFNAQLFSGKSGVGRDADQTRLRDGECWSRMRFARKFMISSGKSTPMIWAFLLQNRQAHFDVGRLQIRDQAPFKTRNQAMLEILNFTRRPVAGQHDLFVGLVQGVESVEKFLLDALFAREKLNIIDQQDIGLPIFFAKLPS